MAAGQGWNCRDLANAYGMGTSGQCYAHALELATAHPELTYCEGRALSCGIVPIEHAWCVDPQGQVIDNVWKPYQTEYFGVRFLTEFVASFTERRGRHSVLAEMFPVELLELDPLAFLRDPAPGVASATGSVFASLRELLNGGRPRRRLGS